MARTRREIQNEINYHQRTINECTRSKNEYNNALNDAKKMLSGLNSSLQGLSAANDDLRRYFTISGKTADSGKIEILKQEVQSAIKDINNQLIPAINACIKDMNSAINYRKNVISRLRRELAQATE